MQVKQLRLHTSNVQKQIATATHYLNVLEIMNRNQQQMYKDISDLTKALTKLVKVIEKLAKQQV